MSWYGASVSFGSYLTHFFAFTLKNWQSEVQHLLLLVFLTSFLIPEEFGVQGQRGPEGGSTPSHREAADAREERGQQS
jgi:hypothetical protein